MPKKERAKAKGGARAAAPIRAVPLAAALAAALLFGLWSMRRGCTDVSALNFAPAATADDGTCVGGMHDLSGAFEFQTVAAAAPKQLDAIGIEFEANRAQNLVVLTKVIPGSAAAANGAREGDELLALRGTSATVLVSSRGHTGTVDAVQHVMDAQPGAPLVWVLRHASALGGIEDIDLTYEAATVEALPPVTNWQDQQQLTVKAWSNQRAARQLEFSTREDLRWCRAVSPNLRHDSLNGWVALAKLTNFEERLSRTVVGRTPKGGLDVEAEAIRQRVRMSHNHLIVTAVHEPSELACCSYGMASSYEGAISVGDEILTLNGAHIARQGPHALEYATSLTPDAGRATMLVLKQKVAAGTRGDTMKSKVEKAIKMVDTQKAKLDAAEATRAMRLMKLAMRHTGRADVPVWMANHTGSVTLTEWTSFANSLHQWALRDSSSDTSNGQAEGGMAMPAGGFRREILQLAVEAMAKELELSLLMIRALTVEGIIKGHWEKRDQYEELIMSGYTHGGQQASSLRLSMQFSKLMQSLVWLNQTAAACALGELAISEAVYSRANQASAHFTRGIPTVVTGWVPRPAVRGVADHLEAHAADIQAEYRHARSLAVGNPNAGSFFKPAEEPLSMRSADDVQELELFRRGFELKHCATIFPRTCEIMRQLPEASKFAGSVHFATIAPGTVLRPHFALANDHLRLHLGIDVPEPEEVDLHIGSARYGWEEGKVIGFDESILHSIRHRGQRSHTVLVVDILHPNHPDSSELLRDTTTDEEVDAIEERQEDWHGHAVTMSADQGGSQQQQEGNRASHHLSSDEMKATIKAKRDEIHAKESKGESVEQALKEMQELKAQYFEVTGLDWDRATKRAAD